MSKLPVPTAKEVNDQHALAKSTAETAVKHAIKCGQMLARKKEQLGRGGFDEWVETYCDFGRSSAYAYMKVAVNSSRALENFRSIQQALGYKKPKEISATSSRPLDDSAPEPLTGAKSAGAVEPTPAPAPAAPPTDAGALSASADGEPEWTEADEAEYHAQEEINARARIEAAIAADDKLAEAFEQIRRQAALLANANAARDRAMNQAAEAVRLLKAEQRKTARLERELEKLRGKKAA